MSHSEEIGPDLGHRAAKAWLPLTFVALLAWLDWIMNRSILFLLVVGGAAVAAILYQRELSQRLGLSKLLGKMPPAFRAVVRAAPPLLYFLWRGEGTSGAGWLVAIVVSAAVAAASHWGRQIDSALGGFFQARDRILPFKIRAILALILPLVMAFTVIHGSLADVAALLGGPTTQPQVAPGLLGRFFISTVLTVVVTILLMRKAAKP